MRGMLSLHGRHKRDGAKFRERIESLLVLLHSRCVSTRSAGAKTGYTAKSKVNGTTKCILPLGKGTNHCKLVNWIYDFPFYVRSHDGTGGPGLLAREPVL